MNNELKVGDVVYIRSSYGLKKAKIIRTTKTLAFAMSTTSRLKYKISQNGNESFGYKVHGGDTWNPITAYKENTKLEEEYKRKNVIGYISNYKYTSLPYGKQVELYDFLIKYENEKQK